MVTHVNRADGDEVQTAGNTAQGLPAFFGASRSSESCQSSLVFLSCRDSQKLLVGFSSFGPVRFRPNLVVALHFFFFFSLFRQLYEVMLRGHAAPPFMFSIRPLFACSSSIFL